MKRNLRLFRHCCFSEASLVKMKTHNTIDENVNRTKHRRSLRIGCHKKRVRTDPWSYDALMRYSSVALSSAADRHEQPTKRQPRHLQREHTFCNEPRTITRRQPLQDIVSMPPHNQVASAIEGKGASGPSASANQTSKTYVNRRSNVVTRCFPTSFLKSIDTHSSRNMVA